MLSPFNYVIRLLVPSNYIIPPSIQFSTIMSKMLSTPSYKASSYLPLSSTYSKFKPSPISSTLMSPVLSNPIISIIIRFTP